MSLHRSKAGGTQAQWVSLDVKACDDAPERYGLVLVVGNMLPDLPKSIKTG